MKILIAFFFLLASASSLFTQKILAETNVAGERAIEGRNTDNTSSSSFGLYAKSYGGLQAFADGASGFAGVGTANGASGIGFYGIAPGVNGRGILGLHNNIAGIEAGVEGRSASRSDNASGILGEITSTTPGSFSAGVRGINKGTAGLGVGVYGSHDGNGWGVYGTVGPASLGWAGYFEGGKGLRVSPKIGINSNSPEVELVVSQQIEVESVVDVELQNLAGIMIEAVDDAAVLLYVDETDDLNFAFGSGTSFTQRAYIWKPTGDFVAFSDRRLKKDIRPFDPVLNKVLDLNPSWYSFVDDDTDTPTIGFIAQEVQALFPEIVHEKNGKLALTYDNFAVLAIKAIQEQQEIIRKLSDRLAALESAIYADN